MPILTHTGELFDITIDYANPGLLIDNDKLLLLFKGCRILNEQQPFTRVEWDRLANPVNYRFRVTFDTSAVYTQTFELIPGVPDKLVSQTTTLPIPMTAVGQLRVLRDHIRSFHEDFNLDELTVESLT